MSFVSRSSAGCVAGQRTSSIIRLEYLAEIEVSKVDPIFTDEVNEYGPLGNDTGADVLILKKKKKKKNGASSYRTFSEAWEIGDYDWDDLDANLIVEEMQRSPRS